MRRGVHQGESQIALGAWEDTQGDQDGSKTKERVNSGVPKLQDCTRVSITNDKRATGLHELAQCLRKIPIKYQPNWNEIEPNNYSLRNRTHNRIRAAIE